MKEKYYRYSLKLSDKRIVKLVRSYIYHCKKYLLYFQEVEQNQTPDICFIDNDEDLIELKTNDQLAQPYIIFLHDQKKLTPRTSSLSYLYVPDFEKEWSKILQKIVYRLAYAPKYLMAKSYKEYQFIDLSKIAYLEADNFNTIVVLTTGRSSTQVKG